jgi:hypothetical protein
MPPPVRSDADGGPVPPVDGTRLGTPAADDGALFEAVRDAWRSAREARDDRHPALHEALAAYAQDARARDVPIGRLLRTLDTLAYATPGEPGLEFGRARELAGAQLIRSYFRTV